MTVKKVQKSLNYKVRRKPVTALRLSLLVKRGNDACIISFPNVHQVSYRRMERCNFAQHVWPNHLSVNCRRNITQQWIRRTRTLFTKLFWLGRWVLPLDELSFVSQSSFSGHQRTPFARPYKGVRDTLSIGCFCCDRPCSRFCSRLEGIVVYFPAWITKTPICCICKV